MKRLCFYTFTLGYGECGFCSGSGFRYTKPHNSANASFARMGPLVSRLVLKTGIVSLAILTPAFAAAVEFSSIGIGLISDSNPVRAQFRDDIVFGQQASIGINASLFSVTSEKNDGWGLFGSASFDINGTYLEDSSSSDTSLGQNTLQFSFEAERTLATLPGTPITVLGANAGYLDSGTDIRDSSTFGVSASLSYQPLQVLDVTIGLRHDERFAESAVFDTSKTQLFSSAFFGLSPKLGLLAEAQLIIGDEVSTATPTLNIVQEANVIVPDDAFGGFSERRFAYQLDATSVLGSLGGSYVVQNNILLDTKVTYIFTDADNGIDYSRWLLSFALNYSFNQ